MTSSSMNNLRLALWAVALFVATLVLHTQHNDFAWYYHPDEPGKVEQVLGMRPWNFHHPMLLLTCTKLAVSTSGATEPQTTVELGRCVSAVFTGISIVALSLLAYRLRGWSAAIAAGITLLLHHQLYELAHYMKEDPALLLGIAVTLLAAHVYQTSPGLAAALGLGTACGIAISGKYLGVISLAFAIPVIARNRRHGAFTAAAVSMIVVIVLVNFPLLKDWKTFSASFAKETKLVVEGQGQMTQSVPHSRYWSIFLANTTPVIWGLLLLTIWVFARRRRELTMVEWMIFAFPFLYAVALSFSPKDNDRYFLPATGVFTLLAAVGVTELGRFSRDPRRALIIQVVAGLALIAAQLPSWTKDRGGLLRYQSAFQRDDTADLVAWLRQNVPATAAIAKDDKVILPTIERHGEGPGAELLPNQILTDDYVADFGSIEALRAKGVTHLVISQSTYGKFDREGLRPKENASDDFHRRKMFYTLLRRDFEPVKNWPRGTVIYLHPGLEVYRIAP